MNNNGTEPDGVTDSTGLNVQTYYKCETCGRELPITTKCSARVDGRVKRRRQMIDTNYGEGVDPYEQEMLSHEFDGESI